MSASASSSGWACSKDLKICSGFECRGFLVADDRPGYIRGLIDQGMDKSIQHIRRGFGVDAHITLHILHPAMDVHGPSQPIDKGPETHPLDLSGQGNQLCQAGRGR